MKNIAMMVVLILTSVFLVGCGGVVRYYPVPVQDNTPYVVNDHMVTNIPPGMKPCNLGIDPVDRGRRLQQGEEFALLDHDTVVTMTTGSGKDVTCALREGTSVSVSKGTGRIIWIQVCGNQVLNEVYVPLPRRRPPSIIRTVIIERHAPTTYGWAPTSHYYNSWGGYGGRDWGGGGGYGGGRGATTSGGVTIYNGNR